MIEQINSRESRQILNSFTRNEKQTATRAAKALERPGHFIGHPSVLRERSVAIGGQCTITQSEILLSNRLHAAKRNDASFIRQFPSASNTLCADHRGHA